MALIDDKRKRNAAVKRRKYRTDAAYRLRANEKTRRYYQERKSIPEFLAWTNMTTRIGNHRRTLDSLLRRMERTEKTLLKLLDEEKLLRAAWTEVRLARRRHNNGSTRRDSSAITQAADVHRTQAGLHSPGDEGQARAEHIQGPGAGLADHANRGGLASGDRAR